MTRSTPSYGAFHLNLTNTDASSGSNWYGASIKALEDQYARKNIPVFLKKGQSMFDVAWSNDAYKGGEYGVNIQVRSLSIAPLNGAPARVHVKSGNAFCRTEGRFFGAGASIFADRPGQTAIYCFDGLQPGHYRVTLRAKSRQQAPAGFENFQVRTAVNGIETGHVSVPAAADKLKAVHFEVDVFDAQARVELSWVNPAAMGFAPGNGSRSGTSLVLQANQEQLARLGMNRFVKYLTENILLSNQTWRNLFGNNTVSSEDGLGIRDTTFMFTDLKGSTALYERIGDLKAWSLIRNHFLYLQNVIVANEGAIVKTIGDAVVATFTSSEKVTAAAVQMLAGIEELNRKQHEEEIILKIGIHEGPSIAVTMNERLDYFGQTVNIAARIQSLANANEIYISDEVYSHESVKQLLSENDVQRSTQSLKGIRSDRVMYCISARRRNTFVPARLW